MSFAKLASCFSEPENQCFGFHKKVRNEMSADQKPEEIKDEPLTESSLDDVVGGATNGGATAASAGKVTVQDFHFTKTLDKSSA